MLAKGSDMLMASWCIQHIRLIRFAMYVNWWSQILHSLTKRPGFHSPSKQSVIYLGLAWKWLCFDNDEDRSWMLAVAITHFWAQYQLRNRMLPNADLVIRAMVYSFVKCSSQVQEESSGWWSHTPAPADTFRDPNWMPMQSVSMLS